MAMTLQYKGEFLSRAGVTWRVEILRETEDTLDVEELVFPAEEPLLLDWDEKSKEEVMCSSTATLTIESQSDREFIDLYSIAPGQIRMDVYREDSLYWSGCLDPEFYEEPYDRGAYYDVSLTFSDFGILKRIPYALSGRHSLEEILAEALDRSKLNYSKVDSSLISTYMEDGTTALTLSGIALSSDNFFDEDGIAFTYFEVLEGMFQPLGLRMIQRAGKIYIYDLNALYESGGSSEIYWESTGQVMGTDKVYNNIKITFSPYASGEIVAGAFEYQDTYGSEWTNLQNTSDGVKYNGSDVPSGVTAPECYSYYVDYDESHRRKGKWDYNLIDFTIFISSDHTKCSGLAEIGSGNYIFKILPNLGGTESEGVVGGFYTGGHGNLSKGWSKLKGISPTTHGQTMAFKTYGTYLPALSDTDTANHFIRIRMETMFDVRYNPFEAASSSEDDTSDTNQNANYADTQELAPLIFVPVAIVVKDDDGNVLCHYSNETIMTEGSAADSIKGTAGEWKDGEASWGEAWLSYYDTGCFETSKGNTYITVSDDSWSGGWKTNRQNFGPINVNSAKGILACFIPIPMEMLNDNLLLFDSFLQAPEGQFIPYPPYEGHLEVTVYNGFWFTPWWDKFYTDTSKSVVGTAAYTVTRWWLYKAPVISVVRNGLNFDEAEVDDVEYTGVLNEDAKDDLELSTICGTTDSASPTAKGVYMESDSGSQITKLTRAGVTDHPEQLFIATLYSQFSDRMTTLEGEVSLESGGIKTYTEEAQDSDVKFMMVADSQNPIADTSDSKFIELRPDEYEGK